jgi:hypothetical protein
MPPEARLLRYKVPSGTSRDAFREGAIARNFDGLKLFGGQPAVECDEGYGHCEEHAEPSSFLHVVRSTLLAL